MKTLYDVFSAIRDDEGDHVSTMKACLDPSVAVNSPSIEKQLLVGGAVFATAAYFLSTGEALFEGLEDGGDDILTEIAGMASIGEQFMTEDDSIGLIDQLLNGDNSWIDQILDGHLPFDLGDLEGLRELASNFLDIILEILKF